MRLQGLQIAGLKTFFNAAPGALLLMALSTAPMAGLEYHGRVTFGELAVPGATVTATRAGTIITAITDESGYYSIPDLPDGDWSLQVEKTGFVSAHQQIEAAPGRSAADWQLQLLPPNQVRAVVQTSVEYVSGAPQQAESESGRLDAGADNPDQDPASELTQKAGDSLLINGSVNNGAFSPFAQAPSFGNFRHLGSKSLYTASIGFNLRNAALDAKAYSLTGQDTPKPFYNHFQGMLSAGGPLNIPHWLPKGPNFTVNYQWTRNRNVTVATTLMPTEAQRNGSFPSAILDPLTGQPFPDNLIPQSRMSYQALSLIGFYPLPNFNGGARYNYQVPLVGGTHQDDLQTRVDKNLGASDQLSGMLAFQSVRQDNPNVFAFLDNTETEGFLVNLKWRHQLRSRSYGALSGLFSRYIARTTPFFAGRRNVAGEAGIGGSNQDPNNWGPPALVFASGVASLSDVQQSLTRMQIAGMAYDAVWNRGRHTVSYGGDFRRQQINLLTQQDPRGTFTFTGTATGSDFAGFLLGVPDASSISFGNADKYLRSNSATAYGNDDWRATTGFTINAGLRWEYTSPLTELYGRLVNLEVSRNFTSATPIVANQYPGSLLRPDRKNLAPRLAFAWRPLPASPMVLRGGYGVYYDTSIYQTIATQMTQQAPLSTSVRVQNTPENPLTLADGFRSSRLITPTTFAVDPGFHPGYSQNWQLSIQKDLPWGLVVTAQYSGIKGTRLPQQFLPNTYPGGATSPSGFVYMSSNGNSTRQAGEIQVRRRLRRGLAAELRYTFSKSIDDSGLGGTGPGATGLGGTALGGTGLIAQNWLDLRAERALSNFDQRHLLNAQLQYTTNTDLIGARRVFFQEWTMATQITAGTGLPLTPVYLAVVEGTGVTGSIRPDYTGAPVYGAPAGLALNPAAFAPPAFGWGNAGRNTITGPSQFTLSVSLARTFRVTDYLSTDFRVDAANALNHPVFPSWNTTINSTQFGLPNPANPMRNVQITVRVRF